MRRLSEIPRRDWIIAVIFLILNAADAWITLHAKHHAPGMYEVNPLMRWALGHGDLFFIVFKMTLATFLTYFSLAVTFTKRINTVLLIGSILIGLVVVWNILDYAIFAAGL